MGQWLITILALAAILAWALVKSSSPGGPSTGRAVSTPSRRVPSTWQPPAGQPDYIFQQVELCVLSGMEPPQDILPVGAALHLAMEPSNPADHQAVMVVNSTGIRVGYLYRGTLKDAVWEVLLHRGTATGTVLYYNAKYGDLTAAIRLWIGDRPYGYTFPLSPNDLAKRIVSARKQIKMTQKDLSALTGIPVPQVSKYENGRTFYVKTNDLRAIADFTGVTVDWLLTGN